MKLTLVAVFCLAVFVCTEAYPASSPLKDRLAALLKRGDDEKIVPNDFAELGTLFEEVKTKLKDDKLLEEIVTNAYFMGATTIMCLDIHETAIKLFMWNYFHAKDNGKAGAFHLQGRDGDTTGAEANDEEIKRITELLTKDCERKIGYFAKGVEESSKKEEKAKEGTEASAGSRRGLLELLESLKA